jgi:hypothetical protein
MNYLKSFIAFSISFFLFCNNAWSANWVFVKASGGTTHYFDNDSVRKNGSILNLKLMANDDKSWTPSSRRFDGPKTKRTSRIWNTFIDCSRKLYKFTYIEVYSEHMGTGILVEAEEQNRGWIPMSDKNKSVSTSANIICSKFNL